MIEKLNERIIKLLIEHQKYAKASELANDLGVNEKTIRRRIQQINEGLLENGAFIDSKKGRGFKITIDNDEKFQKYYQ